MINILSYMIIKYFMITNINKTFYEFIFAFDWDVSQFIKNILID